MFRGLRNLYMKPQMTIMSGTSGIDLRVRTGRPGEEPIEVKELKKGENKGHKIVLGGSRLDCRIFGIHFKSYAPVLANANLKLWSWFCQAYGSGQILVF